MKGNLSSSVIAALVLSVITTSGASAQSMAPRPYALGIYAGATMPMGDFKDVANTGYHIGAFGSTSLAATASVRLDAAYNDFGSKDVPFTGGTASYGTKISHVTVGVQYDLGQQTEIAGGGGSIPYISVGAGFYRFSFDDSCSGTGCTGLTFGSASETRWGLNFGAGANFFLSGFTPFVDIHYHTIAPKTNEVRTNMILASFGLKF